MAFLKPIIRVGYMMSLLKKISSLSFIPSKLLAESQRTGFINRTTELIPQEAEPVHLTERQKDVLMLLAQGAPIKRICRDLNLSEGTVKTHVAAIYRAFGATNRTEALLAARRAGYEIAI